MCKNGETECSNREWLSSTGTHGCDESPALWKSFGKTCCKAICKTHLKRIVIVVTERRGPNCQTGVCVKKTKNNEGLRQFLLFSTTRCHFSKRAAPYQKKEKQRTQKASKTIPLLLCEAVVHRRRCCFSYFPHLFFLSLLPAYFFVSFLVSSAAVRERTHGRGSIIKKLFIRAGTSNA